MNIVEDPENSEKFSIVGTCTHMEPHLFPWVETKECIKSKYNYANTDYKA